MKLLFVQESDWLRRGPHQQHQLADRLSLRGHQIRVIDYEIGWRDQKKAELYSKRQVFSNVSKVHPMAKITVIRPGIIKVPILDYGSLLFSHRREIRRQVKEFTPDVIVGFSILNSYLATRIARQANIPFIYYWIDVLHRLIPFKLFWAIGKELEERSLREADRVLVINEKLKDYVIQLGASPERTQVLRAGIDIKQFDLAVNGSGIRSQYGLNKEDVVLFFMGWLYHFSGLKEVALQLAKGKYPNLKLLIVGEGDAYKELQQIREKYNLQKQVILTGKKPYPEIPAFIAASDICLLPAYPTEEVMQDIVPIKMYEYLAMAKPVISTRLPGVMTEFGEDNGVIYVPSPEEVVAKALDLVRSGNLKQLGLKARSFVEKYSWDNITSEFEKFLKEAIKEKHG